MYEKNNYIRKGQKQLYMQRSPLFFSLSPCFETLNFMKYSSYHHGDDDDVLVVVVVHTDV